MPAGVPYHRGKGGAVGTRVRVVVDLPPALREELQRVAALTGRTVTDLVQQAWAIYKSKGEPK